MLTLIGCEDTTKHAGLIKLFGDMGEIFKHRVPLDGNLEQVSLSKKDDLLTLTVIRGDGKTGTFKYDWKGFYAAAGLLAEKDCTDTLTGVVAEIGKAVPNRGMFTVLFPKPATAIA